MGEACPNSLFKLELRKGTYILEFRIGDDFLTREFNINSVNEEVLLKVSLNDISSKDDYCIKVKDANQYLFNEKHKEFVDLPYKEYKEILDLEDKSEKVYLTLLNNKWGAIKYNGKELIAPKFQSFYKLLFEKFLCFKIYENRYQIFSLLGNLICSISAFGNLNKHQNYLVLKDHEGQSAIFDNRLRPRTQFVYDVIESIGEEDGNYFKVLKDGYWGLIQLSDTTTEYLTVLPCKFEEIEHAFPGFSIEKYIQVKYDNVYYSIDKEGLLREDLNSKNALKDYFVFAKKRSINGKRVKLRF